MTKIALAAAAAAALAALAAMPAAAADFSFSGSLDDPNDVLFVDFTVGGTSLVTLRTYSYAGGTNAGGQTFAAGGFDPILTLFDSAGVLIDDSDDGGCAAVPADPTTALCYDTFLELNLAPGTYTVAVSQSSNFALGPDLSGGFENDAVDFGGRTQAFAFDVLNVDIVSGGVPEPSNWALLIGGFGMTGGALRRRQQARVTYA